MTEQEQQRLISGLIKQREAWQPARQRAHTKPVVKRMSQRDRELMEWNHPPPQIFTHSDFFENKTDRKTVSYGKTTQTARLS